MATLLSKIVEIARGHLVEATASYWSDAFLLDLAILGVNDLWGAVNDLYQDHFLTIDATNVSQAANATSLAGVPADVFRIHLIEPRTLSTNVGLFYEPKDYGHPDFVRARGQSAIDPTDGTIYYDVMAAGAPIGAPTIVVAPIVSSAVLLRLVYVPTVGTLTLASNNPIPGASDNALVSWVVAYARAREREDRAPDSEWLTAYKTEKVNLLNRLQPRQAQEPQVAEAFFETYW